MKNECIVEIDNQQKITLDLDSRFELPEFGLFAIEGERVYEDEYATYSFPATLFFRRGQTDLREHELYEEATLSDAIENMYFRFGFIFDEDYLR